MVTWPGLATSRTHLKSAIENLFGFYAATQKSKLLYLRIVLGRMIYERRILDLRESKEGTGINHTGPSMTAAGSCHMMGGEGISARCDNGERRFCAMAA